MEQKEFAGIVQSDSQRIKLSVSHRLSRPRYTRAMAARTASGTIEEIFGQLESRQADGTGIIYDLQHGIRLGIDNPHRRIPITHVADFLTQALSDFKENEVENEGSPY